MAKRTYHLTSPAPRSGSAIDYAAELNPQQREAVTSPFGPALVIAGAGSGKTRTLTYRVAYLLEKGIQPGNILLLTFTNKAAKEMIERVSSLVPGEAIAIWGGTFHSIGNRILRRHAERLGYRPNFSIMDRDDQNAMLSQAIKECQIDPERKKEKRFPKPAVLAEIYSLAQNLDQPLRSALTERFEHLEEYFEDIAAVAKQYEKKKLSSNALDFDDLQTKTLALLNQEGDLREGFQSKFRAILVDEYQDTNPVQSKLVDLLAAKHRNVMVVGDDAQSIYSWRGADFRNIMQFPVRFPDAKVYRIETNYRSVPEVLSLANESISANVHQFEKELQAARPSLGFRPALVEMQDPNIQSMFVAQRIQELHERDGVPLREIAVLYRAHFHSMELQFELTNRKIPFRITSGLRFFEQAHIKDITSFLRFVVNPLDEVAFKRMLGLIQGVGEATSDKLWRSWAQCDASKAEGPPESYSRILEGFKIPSRAEKDWRVMGEVLDELIGARPADMIKSVVEGMYDDFLKTEFTNYERRRQDIDQFTRYSESFEDAASLLSQLSLLSAVDDGGSGRAGREDDEIVLSTVHQAKGLEWKAVFLIWLTEGMFPSRRAIEDNHDAKSSFEEERRLFYVAVTRACDQLYLTYPRVRPGNYSGDYYQSPSSFLTELPDDLMEEWDIGGGW